MKIFLSHSSEDKHIVRKFQFHLPNHIHVWLDENDLGLGEKFPAAIEKAITEECDFVIVFISKASERSRWVQREVEWALQREKELGRVFLLPLLLEDIRDEAQYPKLDEKLYLSCFEHSDGGVTLSARKLSDYLFAFVSRYFGKIKISPAQHYFEEMKDALMNYKERAYILHATLGDSIAVISTNEAAFNNFAKAVNDYNEFTSVFIPKLAGMPGKVRKFWGNNLANEMAELANFIETKAYREHVFALNTVRESVILCTEEETRLQQDIAKLDQEKNQLLATVSTTLQEVSSRSTTLLSKIEKEL